MYIDSAVVAVTGITALGLGKGRGLSFHVASEIEVGPAAWKPRRVLHRASTTTRLDWKCPPLLMDPSLDAPRTSRMKIVL